jgi:Protein of unknown function (DUF4199)
MLNKLSATYKGLITALLMIGLSLAIYYSGLKPDSQLQYLIYLLYAAGITWSIYSFSRSADNPNKFGAYFQQGFKCFIVVTLFMVLFTYAFNKMHPEFREEMAKAVQKEMEAKGNSTPAEIASNVAKMKEYYLTMLISGAIFAYLLMGAVIAAVASLLFTKRN